MIHDVQQTVESNRKLLNCVPSLTVMGREANGTGRVQNLDVDWLRSFFEEWPGALQDPEGEPILDGDYRPIYEPGDTIDNPTVPVRIFATIALMQAFSEPWRLDRAITLNDTGSDGVITDWVMIANPTLVDNGETLRAASGSYGVFYRLSVGAGRTVYEVANVAAVTGANHGKASVLFVKLDDSTPQGLGYFTRNDAASGSHDGVNILVDSAGHKFERKQWA